MKIKLKKWIAVSALLFSSHAALADVVQTDWQQEGDNLSFINLDDNTEWLSVSVTMGWSLSLLQAELQEGGALEGWHPKSSGIRVCI